MLRKISMVFGVFLFCLFASISFWLPVQASSSLLQETVMAPTVTGSPIASTITVRMDADMPQINVRSGPGTEYEGIGVLLMGQTAPAIGRTNGGDWILIQYPGVVGSTGWVYSPLVILEGATLPIVAPPATPTPRVTSTIDPTLAAQFIITSVATRLPTYTPPPALNIPTFEDNSPSASLGTIPIGFIIIILGVLGSILGLVTLLQNR